MLGARRTNLCTRALCGALLAGQLAECDAGGIADEARAPRIVPHVLERVGQRTIGDRHPGRVIEAMFGRGGQTRRHGRHAPQSKGAVKRNAI